MSESELITRLRERDPSACRFLIETHGKQVYNTALGLLQHHQDAEDLAQEVFAQAFQSLSAFREEAKLSTWLYRITINKIYELQRSRQRKKRFAFMVNLFEAEALKPATEFCHPGVLLENQERATILLKYVNQLPENQKTAFVLHKMEDVPYAEIADIMQTSVGAVESLLVRARQNLRAMLGVYYQNHLI